MYRETMSWGELRFYKKKRYELRRNHHRLHCESRHDERRQNTFFFFTFCDERDGLDADREMSEVK